MAPAAVLQATTIPQFSTVTPPNKLPTEHLRESSEWNNMGDSALDFDLLAEYLLEDMGAGGFDFGASPEAIGPPAAIDNLKTTTQPASILPDNSGVVTPNPNSDQSAFSVDSSLPGVVVAAQLQQQQQQQQPQLAAVDAVVPTAAAQAPLPAGGDMAGELSQVQQMIAATQVQQQQQQQLVVAPQPSPAQAPQLQIAQQQLPPPTTIQQPAVAPVTMMGMRHAPPPPLAPAAQAAAAPITQRVVAPAPPTTTMTMAAQQPNKRPRLSSAPSIAKANTNKPHATYSFASSVASVNGSRAVPHQHHRGTVPLPPSSIPGGHMNNANGLRNNNKSQAQIDRRRERNRILARRTRLRKKFFFESLQKDVADLQRENAALKSIARSRLKPDDARELLRNCDANERLPSAVGCDGEGGLMAGGIDGAAGGVKKLDREDFSLIQSIQNSQQCFIITDPSLHDNPIVYASDDFLTLTGYSQEEVLGRNCRFLQGTETCPKKVATLRDAVRSGEDVNVTFANYTSQGAPFWNSLFIAALRDADNNIVNFIGVIVKVDGPEPGDEEYGKVLK